MPTTAFAGPTVLLAIKEVRPRDSTPCSSEPTSQYTITVVPEFDPSLLEQPRFKATQCMWTRAKDAQLMQWAQNCMLRYAREPSLNALWCNVIMGDGRA